MFKNANVLLRDKAVHAFVSKMLAQGSGLVISMMLARVMDIEALGVFYLFMQIVNLFSMVVSFGMKGAMQKVQAVHITHGTFAKIFPTLIYSVLNIILSGLFISALLFFGWDYLLALFNAKPLEMILSLVVAVIIMRAVEVVSAAFFRGVGHINAGIYLLDLPRQIAFLVAIWFIWFTVGQASLNNAVESSVYASIIATVTILSYMLLTLIRRGWVQVSFDYDEYKAFVYLCAPMFIHGLTSVVLSSADIWIIAAVLGPDQVAVYSTALKLVSLVIFALGVINFVVPPFIASLYSEGRMDELQSMMQLSASWIGVIGLMFGFVFFMWGEDLLVVLFGEKFIEGGVCLMFLVVGHSVNALVGSPGVLLQMTGHQKLLMNLSLVWAIFNVICNLLVVRYHGIDGVAFVTACTVIGQNINMAIMAKKKVGINTYANFHFNEKLVLSR